MISKSKIIFSLIFLVLLSCASNPKPLEKTNTFDKEFLGSVDPNEVRSKLKEQLPLFRSCLNHSLQKKDIVVNLIFSVNKNGKTYIAKVDKKSELSISETSCLIDVINRTEFPKPIGGGNYDVNQPMKLYQLN